MNHDFKLVKDEITGRMRLPDGVTPADFRRLVEANPDILWQVLEQTTPIPGPVVSGEKPAQLPEARKACRYNPETQEKTYIEPAFTSDTNVLPGYIPEGAQDFPEESERGTAWQIPNPDQYNEYRSTCWLLAIDKSGGTGSGSAFIIGPNHVGTAGHNLFNAKYAGDHWAAEVFVTPAMRSDGTMPYGYVNMEDYYAGGYWVDHWNTLDDWGIVKMTASMGMKTGWLALKYDLDSYVGQPAHVYGYPSGTLVLTVYYGEIVSEAGRWIRYDLPTAGGTSGGPLLVRLRSGSSEFAITGINTRGDGVAYGEGVQFDVGLFNFFAQFRQG